MDLNTQVKHFKQWAASQPQNYGEWETVYPEWQSLYAATKQTLSKSALSGADVELLLFALARDNECEFIRDMLEDVPDRGLILARAAITYPDPDARWQIADFLGARPEPEAIDMLRRFVEDEDEYVRRRALLAAKWHDSVFAEEVARQWIDSPHDYSRLAALTILEELQSAHLKDAIERLQTDSFQFVREKVAVLKKEV